MLLTPLRDCGPGACQSHCLHTNSLSPKPQRPPRPLGLLGSHTCTVTCTPSHTCPQTQTTQTLCGSCCQHSCFTGEETEAPLDRSRHESLCFESFSFLLSSPSFPLPVFCPSYLTRKRAKEGNTLTANNRGLSQAAMCPGLPGTVPVFS